MSRVGKKIIPLPSGVTVVTKGRQVEVKGPKGQLTKTMPEEVSFKVESKEVKVLRASEDRRSRGMHGLARALLQNMITGVSQGFTRSLEINGVGYRAEAKKGALSLALGYSHPIEVTLPQGIDAKVDKNRIDLSGIDREQLGQLVAVIRSQRAPEPYKGKGVKYVEETIKRKEGKTGAG